MAEITIEISEDLKENLQRPKEIVAKSKFTEKDAEELSNKVKIAMLDSSEYFS